MSQSIAQIVRYYAFSLTDAQSGRASITRAAWHRLPYRRLGNHALTTDTLEAAAAPPRGDDLTTLTRADIAAWADQQSEWVALVWHPILFERTRSVRHGIQTHQWAPDMLAPISVSLYAHRDGRLRVAGRPRFSRECLEPAAQGALILGSVDLTDQFYDSNPFPEVMPPTHDDQTATASEVTLAEAAEYALRLFDAACQADPHEPIKGIQFQRRAFGVALPARTGAGAIAPLLRTYDAIETLSPRLPALERCVGAIIGQLAQDTESVENIPRSLERWGTINNDRSLSPDQVNAVVAACALRRGESQAIHGPPGTGKTAILQEIVASKVVESVLRDAPAPQIVIASTNNQAIRNALLSFTVPPILGGKGHVDALLLRRWIDQWPGLGVYNAAMHASPQAQMDGLPTIEQMESLENNADLRSLSMTFIQSARTITRNGEIASIEQATNALRSRLKAEAKEQQWARTLPRRIKEAARKGALKGIDATLSEHEKAWRRYGWMTGGQDSSAWKGLRQKVTTVVRAQEELQRLMYERKQLALAVEEAWNKDWLLRTLKGFRSHSGAKRIARKRIREIEVRGKPVQDVDVEFHKLENSIDDQRRTLAVNVRELVQGEQLARWQSVLDDTLHERARHRWFWFAIHVREGEWLDTMLARQKARDSDGRTHHKVQSQLARRFMLAPVMVCTLHRLPKVLSYWEVQRQSEMPLFEQADLLIVDEAGQCAPDVGSASIGLAKSVVALGDRAQLEPIWSLELREDLGNRIASDLVDSKAIQGMTSDRITRSGGDTSSGSLLHLMEQTSRYHSVELQGRGILLTQHRRCLPDIFEFCNSLAYEGQLASARIRESVSPWPAFSYMDCPGNERVISGSRCNDFEAMMVAQAIAEKASSLRAAYGRSLGDIVGVITPFKAQAELIEGALVECLGRRHGITVGTVHSLQGAEKPVVILSLTYSALPAGRSYFFDQSVSMLNVAASRAQDSFLVVGDLEVLNQAGLPGRTLGEHCRKFGQRLSWPNLPDTDTLRDRWKEALQRSLGVNVSYKVTAEGENALLKALSERGLGKVVIVSSEIDRIGLQAAGNAMIKAAQSGMQVVWLLSHEYLLNHPDSAVFMKAIETIRKNGVEIKYVGPVFCNILVLPAANIAIWGESSWLTSPTPRAMAATQSDAAAFLARIEQIHGVSVETPDSDGRLSA